jgi:hypothetical protein
MEQVSHRPGTLSTLSTNVSKGSAILEDGILRLLSWRLTLRNTSPTSNGS